MLAVVLEKHNMVPLIKLYKAKERNRTLYNL